MPSSSRIVSVDLMRGLTIAAMILVNNPGSWIHMYTGLAHAKWGAIPAPADFIFPFFLFLVGVSTPLALRRREAGTPVAALLSRAGRRGALLFAIGVGLNLFPEFNFSILRIPGVLQRIAVVSFGCAVVTICWGMRGVAAGVVALLLGYALLLVLVPVPGVGEPVLTAETSLPVWLDERLLGSHTWRGPGDPEGVLSTLGALATGWIGVLVGLAFSGRRTRHQLVSIFAGAGIAAVALGFLVGLRIPVVKEIWTSSYALITAGAALVAIALLHRSFEEPPSGADWKVVALLGRQALLAYVIAHLMSDLSIKVIRLPIGESGSMSLHFAIYEHLLVSWLPGPLASLAYSLLFVATVSAVVWGLDRRGLRIRL